MYSAAGDTTSLVPGFPIRTSSDPRSVDSSPRHIAASHVLHRLPVPRHPPCALKHLQHKTTKDIHRRLRNCTSDTHKHTTTPTRSQARTHCVPRCSQPLSTNQTPHPTTKAGRQQPHSDPTQGRQPPPVSHTRDEEMTGLLSQSPIVCLAIPLTGRSRRPAQRLSCTRTAPTTGDGPSNESPRTPMTPTRCGPARVSWCSLERR